MPHRHQQSKSEGEFTHHQTWTYNTWNSKTPNRTHTKPDGTFSMMDWKDVNQHMSSGEPTQVGVFV